jgi:hypothetical protein
MQLTVSSLTIYIAYVQWTDCEGAEFRKSCTSFSPDERHIDCQPTERLVECSTHPHKAHYELFKESL